MKTVKKAFELLSLLSDNPEAFISSGKIAGALKIKRPTCSLLLKSLKEIGVLEQPSSRGGYRFGYMLYYLTRNGPFRKDIAIPARPLLEDFAEQTGETIILSAFHKNKRIILDCVEGSYSVQIRKDMLLLEDFYHTASGRLLLAFLSPEELGFFLERFGLPSPEIWKEASTIGGFQKALKKINEKGLEMNVLKDKEYMQVAFPVIDEEGRCAAALSVPVPLFRFKGAHGKKIIKFLRDISAKISTEVVKHRRR